MNLKILSLTALLGLTGFASRADDQVLSIRDTITDNHIVFPSSFDTDTKDLQDNWYLQRYTVLETRAAQKENVEPSDQVYISRLQRLPNVIEMPFNSIVKSYIEMYANRKSDLVEKMLGMSLYYMPIFEESLEKYQVPMELKYLPVIESALNPNAVSKAGACGLWQFMATTATGEGLEVNSLVDERRDPIASSDAAAQYLKKLHDMYDDWTLAIAAYNCGPGNVNKAIKRAGDKKDYWEIYRFLPEETRGYVPAFIAANYIMNYYPEHGISHALARKPIVTDTVHISKCVHFQQISDVMGIPMDELRILNPQYRQDIVPGHIRPYALILPSVQAYCYVANEDTIVNHDREKYMGRQVVEPSDGSAPLIASNDPQATQELVVITHKVKRGETLGSIAEQYGVTVESIRTANALTTTRVKTGKVLKINTYQTKYAAEEAAKAQKTTPASSSSSKAKPAESSKKKATPAKKSNKPKTVTYTVKKGDTLDKIARTHGTTVAKLKSANGLKSNTIQIGQTLTIPAK